MCVAPIVPRYVSLKKKKTLLRLSLSLSPSLCSFHLFSTQNSDSSVDARHYLHILLCA